MPPEPGAPRGYNQHGDLSNTMPPKARSSWFTNGLITSAAGIAATTAALAAFGKAKEGSPFTPFNAIAHIAFGDAAATVDGFAARETLTGFGLHASAIAVWGVLYEALAGKTSLPGSLGKGALASALIYWFDYHLVPERLRPGFEKRLGPEAVAVTYALLALSFGLSPLWRRPGA